MTGAVAQPPPRFTTDKIGHGYLPTYYRLLAELPQLPHILEIGVARGEGLAMFGTLRPDAHMYGLDINTAAGFHTAERLLGDQADPALAEPFPDGYFDLIVDDASHDNAKTAATWWTWWPKLAPARVYVIEDWTHAGGLIRGFAGELLDCFAEDVRAKDPALAAVESITYKPGLILVHKAPG